MKTTRDSVDHVRVCCRVRPLNAAEKLMHRELCVNFPPHTHDTIDCCGAAVAAASTDVGGKSMNSGNENAWNLSSSDRHAFTFSRVFRPEADQADVYEHVARPIVADVMAGYNGTIFMYGQTGSGKTHTMFGDLKGGAWAAAASMASGAGEEWRASQVSPSKGPRYRHEEKERRADVDQEEDNDEVIDTIHDTTTTLENGEDVGGEEEQQHRSYPIDRQQQHDNDEEEAPMRFARVTAAATAVDNAATASPSSPSSPSSFCRTRATVTPLGELQQVNILQNGTAVTAVARSRKKQKKAPDYAEVSMSSSPAARPRCSVVSDATVRGKAGAHSINNSNNSAGTVAATINVGGASWRRASTAVACAASLSPTAKGGAFVRDTLSGVIPRAVHDVFQAIADADPSTEFDVKIFFVEVYMEQIRDLLAPVGASSLSGGGASGGTARRPARKLQLHEDVSTNSFYIEGCHMPHVSSAQEVLQRVKAGLRQRVTSATAMNETSSRSHCLLNLTVKSVNHKQGVSTLGKLYLVDLAGSEKVGKTNATGLRLEEAKLINKSLSTLGMVINSLTDHAAAHTPYRNSVLTKILKDSLGGNSHTALVICCSPSPYNAPETLSTLRFGARAKAIENKAVVNRELTPAQLRRMLNSAKEEIERLQNKVRQLRGPDECNRDANNQHSSMTTSPYYSEPYTCGCGFPVLSEQAIGHSGGTLSSDFPVATCRKLRGSSTAATSTSGTASSDAEAAARISDVLEERAAEQARLQQLRADVAQLQDNLNGAHETISTLQEERDGYLDRIRSYQDEVEVWECAHHEAVQRAATHEALLQQCKMLLCMQSSEIKELVHAMQEHVPPIVQAKHMVEVEQQQHLSNASLFSIDNSSQRRRRQRLSGVLSADTTCVPGRLAHSTSTPSHTRATSEYHLSHGLPNHMHGCLSTYSGAIVHARADAESPSPRRQLAAELGDTSLVLPRTSRSQQEHGSGAIIGESFPSLPPCGLSPAVVTPVNAATAAATHVGVDEGDKAREGSLSHDSNEGGDEDTSDAAAQADCIIELENQLSTLAAEHAALQQLHKDVLAELHSKQRILDLRRGHLDTVKEELKREYAVNKELRERLEKEREAVRGPFEMARNDANYWRRRYEEASSRKDAYVPSSRPSESLRGSVRFNLPPSTTDGTFLAAIGGAESGGGCFTISGEDGAAKALLSSRRTSCRGSGEDVLLSLSSESTPLQSQRTAFPLLHQASTRPTMTVTAEVVSPMAPSPHHPEPLASSPLRSRSASPATGFKL